MKQFLSLIALLGAGMTLSAQSATPETLVTGGSYGTTADGLIVTSTIGEYASETLSGDVIMLTQGFQQADPAPIINQQLDLLAPAPQLSVSPNPVGDLVRLDLSAFTVLPKQVQVLNGQGTVVLQRAITSSIQEMDLSRLPAGTYWIRTEVPGGLVQVVKQ